MSGRNQVVGSFSDSCKNMELKHGHILRAECKNAAGHWVTSEIDLNSCIGNLNGYLSWDYTDFTKSSHEIRLTDNGTKIEARLTRQDHGTSEPQGIYLNERIINRDGRLHFVPHNEVGR
ncbi:hypothetical protein Q9L58_002061 [Maublancomyces gigas]|uniref:Cyanovirin-N domain-containing protein n=1 Tax=Discina gigas TaxID=1032678 RepID=A0ABR3GSY9_9PEZI